MQTGLFKNRLMLRSDLLVSLSDLEKTGEVSTDITVVLKIQTSLSHTFLGLPTQD